jgi:hypothetical protein
MGMAWATIGVLLPPVPILAERVWLMSCLAMRMPSRYEFSKGDDGGGSGVALVEGVECWGWFAFYPGFVVGGGLRTFSFRKSFYDAFAFIHVLLPTPL